LELYRFRWQVELDFKRLKSLLQLGNLTARDPPLARTFLYSKLLAALLLEDLIACHAW
jgi:IS4 transposase